MPRIENAVLVRADAEQVFAITNDLLRWPEIFNEYGASKIISEEPAGRFTKIVFELTNNEGSTWRSWRLLDHQELTVVAEREAPRFPFEFMHLRWTYLRVAAGTLMTWVQDFELDRTFEVPLETVVARMNAHTKENQESIRAKIESGAVVVT